TRFCTKGDGFQFLAKFAILPQNANSRKNYYPRHISARADDGIAATVTAAQTNVTEKKAPTANQT
ncbi:hypothetical protein B9055_017160, partial [Klebsiella pneumoniae]